MSIAVRNISTPLGIMVAGAIDEGICMLDFPYRKSMDMIRQRLSSHLLRDFTESEHPLFRLLEEQLAAYFKGTLQQFDLPLVFAGTPFQKRVWTALLDIPYGQTRSYKQQSIYLGDEKAIRAVARSNGENTLAIVVPCHRVIGENGALTGYAGGLRHKKWLLEHEQRHTSATHQLPLFSS